MAETEFGRTRRCHGEAGVVAEARAGPERESETRLKVEEGNRSVVELLTNDSIGREAEPIAVERDRARQIVYAESDDGQARMHSMCLLGGGWRERCRVASSEDEGSPMDRPGGRDRVMLGP